MAVSYVATMAIPQGMISQGMTSCGIARAKSEKNAEGTQFLLGPGTCPKWQPSIEHIILYVSFDLAGRRDKVLAFTCSKPATC